MHVLITEDDWGGQEEARGGEVGDVLEGGEGETKRSGNQEQELENWEVAATAAAAAPFRRRSIIAKLQKRLLAH